MTTMPTEEAELSEVEDMETETPAASTETAEDPEAAVLTSPICLGERALPSGLPMLHRPAAISADLISWNRWRGEVRLALPEDTEVLWMLVRARAAAGDGFLDEQIARLMVHTAAILEHPLRHEGTLKPYDILRSRKAWCEQQCCLFGFFCYHMLGVEGRLVEMKHTDPNEGHTVAEIFYHGRWHLYDVHKDHQTFYRRQHLDRILSFEDLRQDPSPVARQPHWWRAANGEGKEGFYKADPIYYDLQPYMEWPWATTP